MNTGPERAELANLLQKAGLGAVRPETLSLFKGGYSNTVWKAQTDAGPVVIKHYVSDNVRNNPYFPNLPDDEAAALALLAPLGLAPAPLVFLPAPAGGRAILVYAFAEGPLWRGDMTAAARMLGALHGVDPGTGFRKVAASSAAIRAHGDMMLERADTPNPRLMHVRPEKANADEPPLSLIHTDCGPGNIIETAQGLVLIDWQCPARGDAAEDIACFLSPAMMVLYGRTPHGDIQDFLAVYPDIATVGRYQEKAGVLHWRIACYCHFRARQLAVTQPQTAELYGDALEAECSLLEGMRP